ncbi:ribonuclease E inhibitor RraB [Limnoglobus roseus]|uniref:Regulator of ribonuclease activity B domain-containing protein n=1 Tax=Limnoglobus roseus TaxID=2598579 RepID=A0A5C1A2W1_9BACT|nr:ribonuclease E inhibitor RraB [Limnoglobus roseus]QEL13449.1 hypothetical protein PX52LOC_00306 [Limnoglobus roseus]
MQFPSDENGDVLRSMFESGMDLTAAYDIDFEHIFPDLQSAERMCERTAPLGHHPELRELNEPDYTRQGFYYEVRVCVRIVPTHADITRLEQELGHLAESCGGQADGWGVLQD